MEDTIRKNIIEYIYKQCNDNKLSKQLEKHAYDNIKENILFNKNYIYGYIDNIKYICINIKKIQENHENGSLDICYLFAKSSEELFPENWKDSRRRIDEEEKFKHGKKKKSNTTTVTCFKCKKNNIFVSYKQMRSADEPETCFYDCLNCNNKWRK